MVAKKVGNLFAKVFGTRNERVIKRYQLRVEEINALESKTRQLSATELRAKTQAFRDRIADGER